MRVLSTIFLFSMRVFLATLGSVVISAAAGVILLPGPYGDFLWIGLLPLLPSGLVVVVLSALEDHFATQASRRSRGFRAIRFALVLFVAILLLLVLIFALMGTFAREDWRTIVFVSGLFAAASTFSGLAYWLVYVLTAPLFRITPANPEPTNNS
jgi:hypothetical protein